MAELTVLATRLKKARADRGWTLADVAARSGISTTTLSKVERGLLSLTYEKIIDLARGLELGVDALFSAHPDMSAAQSPRTRRSLTRAGEGVPLEMHSVVAEYLNTDLINKKFNPLIYEVKMRSLEEFGPMTAHDGEQFGYVLEGVLELHTEHYEPARLYPGDSFYFDCSMPHAGIAVGDEPCRVLGVISTLNQEHSAALRQSKAMDLERPHLRRDATRKRPG